MKFAQSHEWMDMIDGTVRVGITAHAAELLGDLVFIELPEVGDYFDKGSDCAVVESVKAASDVYCPMSGTIIEINEAIIDDPSLINEDADLWFFKLEPSNVAEYDEYLTEEAYQDFINEV